jgi:hypothetical protein
MIYRIIAALSAAAEIVREARALQLKLGRRYAAVGE